MCIIVKNRFNQRDNLSATLTKLKETADLLKNTLKTDDFKVFQDDDNDDFEIMDTRKKDDDFISIELFNGFWMIDTGWRFHQYFNIVDGRLWLRERMYKYIPLLGATEAYVCAEYCAWNNALWKESKMTFEDWKNVCKKELGGREIEVLDLKDVINRKDYLYDKDPVYLDVFEDFCFCSVGFAIRPYRGHGFTIRNKKVIILQTEYYETSTFVLPRVCSNIPIFLSLQRQLGCHHYQPQRGATTPRAAFGYGAAPLQLEL